MTLSLSRLLSHTYCAPGTATNKSLKSPRSLVGREVDRCGPRWSGALVSWAQRLCPGRARVCPAAILRPPVAKPQHPSTTFVHRSPFLSEDLPFETSSLPPLPVSLPLSPFLPRCPHPACYCALSPGGTCAHLPPAGWRGLCTQKPEFLSQVHHILAV